MKTYFISGIDTDCGKTIVTGLIAKYLLSTGVKVITQKMVQTGTEDIADDIIEHRKIMGVSLYDEDRDKTTCPYVFKLPASPHLSAKLENITIQSSVIDGSTNTLQNKYDVVLLEGAGGLHVPINSDENIIDFVEQRKYPLILVTSAKLGSINHTLMSLEICYHRKINIAGLIYNNYPANNKAIQKDSVEVFQRYLKKYFPKTPLIEIPYINIENQEVDFSRIF
ncbi:MAG: dethiobiotin synthase [Bacteroidota bacterium]|nr:dethiobiotin synthase [Bacteroidota bacterium]